MYDEQFIKQLYDNYKKIITDISDESYNNLKKDLYNQNIIIKSAGVNQDIMVKPDVDDSKVTVSDDNRIYKGTVIWVNSLAKDITISFDSLTAVSYTHLDVYKRQMSDTAIEVKVDENKLRPVDVPIIEPDIDKIKSEVGWQPVISLEQTLKETLEHWRSVD